MIIKYYRQSFKMITESISKFFGAFFSSILLCIIISYMIIFNNHSDEIFRILYCLILSISCFTFIKLLFERFNFRFDKLLLWFVPIFTDLLFYFVLKIFNNNIYSLMCISGFIIFQIVFSLYLCNYDNISTTFSHICVNLFLNFLFCTILLLGSWICIFAFISLIYDFEDSYKIYLLDLIFIFTVIFINMFLSNIPNKNSKIYVSNIFKVITTRIMFPTYITLTLILYFYLSKILITMNFPSNRVNVFGIIASIFYMFFVLSLSQYKSDNIFIDFFIKFSGYFIIPIVLMNFAAMYIRIQEYGLTTSRYISLIFNFSVIIFVVLHESKNIKFIPIFFSIIPIIFTFTPVNIVDIPVLEQSLRLKNILAQNSMFQNDGTIISNTNINFDVRRKIISSYFYIKDSGYNKVSVLDKSIFEKDFNTVFGFDAQRRDSENKYGENLTFEYDFINVEGYKKVRYISYGNIDSVSHNIVLSVDNKEIKYDITGFIKKSLESNDRLENIELEVDTGKFIITFLNYSIINDAIKVDAYGGYLLLK